MPEEVHSKEMPCLADIVYDKQGNPKFPQLFDKQVYYTGSG